MLSDLYLSLKSLPSHSSTFTVLEENASEPCLSKEMFEDMIKST